jgi:hypothetical protein
VIRTTSWLLVLVVCLGTVSLSAQSPASGAVVSSSDELWMKIKSGDAVYVLDSSARETAGTFAKVSQSSLELLVDGQIREIPLSDVREIARRGDPLWNGALIGAAVGGGLTALACGNECTTGERVGVIVTSALIWGAVGMGIDALIHGRTVVYRATPLKTVRFMPVLSRHQVSAALSVGF